MDPEDSPRLEHMLAAYSRYRLALLELFRDLDIADCHAGSPEMLLARLVVAELVSGVALPEHDWATVGVLGPSGERIAVDVCSDRFSLRGGRGYALESATWDQLAIVVFQHAEPVAVHLVSREDAGRVADELSVEAPPTWHLPQLYVNTLLHWNLSLDPVLAATSGVRTIILRPSGE